jgi:RHS repeat-associated protein
MSSTIDARGTTSYNYDQRDRLIKQTETDGKTLQYTYDKASNRTSITTQAGTTTYGYDRYNELTTVTDKSGGVTTYTYDKAGNRTKIQMADGTVETRNYDLLNHLVKQETSNASGVIAGYTYTLDAGGKRVELLENNGRKVNYSYDKIDRLLTEQITDSTNGNRTTGYVYDPIGNRVSKTDSVAGVTTYVYDNNDRLLTETNGTKITTSTYDNNGNNLTRGDGTSLTTNTWDIENRLIQSVTDANTTIYQYDPNGVRVSSKTNGVETRYLVDRNRPHASVILEYNASGTPINEYTYGLSLIEQERGGVKSFYHADGLGSTRFLTDSSGSVTDTYIYDAYGNTISSTGATVNNYLYTGEQFDPNLKEYYLRARYYNPSGGRFTGRDPFEGMLTEPLSLNKYAYVHGNPINNIDPSGWTSVNEQNAVIQEQTILILAAEKTVRFGLQIFTLFRNLELAQQVQLFLGEKMLKNCNNSGDRDCKAGVPIVFFGQQYGKGSLTETTRHIRSAIIYKNLTPLLSAWEGIKPPGHGSHGESGRSWYDAGTFRDPTTNKSLFKNTRCSNQERNPFNTERNLSGDNRGTCDEYPFFSSNEGGYDNFLAGRVSLRLVPGWESGPQGELLNLNDHMMKSLNVQANDFFGKWYGVVAIDSLPQSFGRKRDGGTVWHSSLSS